MWAVISILLGVGAISDFDLLPRTEPIADREKILEGLTLPDLTAVIPIAEPQVRSRYPTFVVPAEPAEESKLIGTTLKELRSGNFELAIESLAKYLSRFPDGRLNELALFIRPELFFRVQEKTGAEKYDIAIKDYEFAIANHPQSIYTPYALYLTAVGYFRMGFFFECAEIIERTRREFPNHELEPYLKHLMAEQYIHDGKNTLADELLQTLIETTPDHEMARTARLRRGAIAFKEGQLKNAMAQYRLAFEGNNAFIRAHPNDLIYYTYALMNEADYDEVIRTLQNYFNVDPKAEFADWALILIAEATYRRGDLIASYRLFQDARRIYADRDTGRMAELRVADIRFVVGALDAHPRSVETYDRVVAESTTEPIRILGRLHAGAILTYFRDYRGTVKRLLELSRATDTAPWAARLSGRILRKTLSDEVERRFHAENRTGALVVYMLHERDLLASYDNTEILLALGETARELGALKQAMKLFQKIIFLRSDRSGREQALLSVIDLLIDQEQFDEVPDRLRRFDFAYPSSDHKWKYYYLWGRVYRHRGDRERARENFEASLELSRTQLKSVTGNAETYLQLTSLYRELNMPEKARDTLTAYINLKRIDSDEGGKETILTLSELRLGDLLLTLKEYDRAYALYERILERLDELKIEDLNPFKLYSLNRLAHLDGVLGQVDRQAGRWKLLQERDPAGIFGKWAKEEIAWAALTAQTQQMAKGRE